ncbi:ATP-binding protein [Streptomyces sp. NPDC007162]|uniref:ATP-binding protein n=1 Tax=Streptomyces sp. NPDC007162 TaxID=3156917 RepID=UPI0033ED01C8
MGGTRASWVNTTHDWSAVVDADHLARIRQDPALFAPGGPGHLVLEVVAHAADEAASRGGGECLVTLHTDGSVSVTDDGRGTDTRVDEHGQVVRKPVMATKDLRFFDRPETELLPDGHPRRGMSVVAALSTWLIHTNRRLDGSWTQRYEHGVPVTGLEPVEDDGTTGTGVRFLPDGAPRPQWSLTTDEVTRWSEHWPDLTVRLAAGD